MLADQIYLLTVTKSDPSVECTRVSFSIIVTTSKLICHFGRRALAHANKKPLLWNLYRKNQRLYFRIKVQKNVSLSSPHINFFFDNSEKYGSVLRR